MTLFTIFSKLLLLLLVICDTHAVVPSSLSISFFLSLFFFFPSYSLHLYIAGM